jgi:hypothetical protein
MAEELVISNSKAKTYRRCANQYRYKYVMKLKPKMKKVQLERGTWIHECLMHHYDGEDWRIPHRENTKAFNNLFEEMREDLGDLPAECERILKSYFRNYRDEDSTYRTIDTEMDEIITLPNGLKFRFIIDRIYEDSTGGLWLQDHKTVKNFLPADFMLLDAQLSRYFWCARKMGYTPLRGIEFNELRTKAPTVPPLTEKTGAISTAKKYDTDYWTFLKTIKDHGLDPKDYMPTLRRLRAETDRFFRRTRLPQDEGMMRRTMKELVDTADQIKRAERKKQFPRTPLKSCRWDCDYLDLCTVELQGGDGSSIIKHNYNRVKREEVLDEPRGKRT